MNLPETLSREVERVTRLDEQYGRFGGISGINVEPAREMMCQALDRAHTAASSPDIQEQIAAHNELQGFEE